MAIEFRSDDPIRPDDDVVIRAGSGDVHILVQRAIDNAGDYEQLLHDGFVRSVFTISVHVPRGELSTPKEVLADAF